MNQLGNFERNVVRAIELIYADLKKNWADHDRVITGGSDGDAYQNDSSYVDPEITWLHNLERANNRDVPIQVVTLIFNDVYGVAYNKKSIDAFRSSDPRAYLPVQFQVNGVTEKSDEDQKIIKAQSGFFNVYKTDLTTAARDVQYIHETQRIWSNWDDDDVRWFPDSVETPITIKNGDRDNYSPNDVFIGGKQVGRLNYAGYLGIDSNNGTVFLKKGMTVNVTDTDPSIFLTFTVPFDCFAQFTLDYKVWQPGEDIKVTHVQLYDLRDLSHQIVITDHAELYPKMKETGNLLITFKEPIGLNSGSPF